MKLKKTSLLNIPSQAFWESENMIDSWRGIPVAGKESPQLAMRRALEFCAFCHRHISIPSSPPVMNGALSERNRLSLDGSFRLIPSFKKSPFITLCLSKGERASAVSRDPSLPFYASRLTPHVSRLRKMDSRYKMSGMTE